ncbi:MAG: hypothetical protein GFH27_549307n29 [Chloroflexi bacterium AL-W]|nr:hypothetical protein [Chloroflexi bacterium AL-N1]NOK69061.1 hypothetical protein [Chloroflexi bacterium AL-N10]NOK77044.1 hypothetical protein [Chloroflexi bacterium AL-N5]NOK83689.1 hypothetical protein [Chloroflexi bacterium AL-W]NOK90899.1 hypothetical protein [Chloroflexi bacterium AL-N15]
MEPIIFNAEIGGEVNDIPLIGGGTAQYIPDQNTIIRRMRLKNAIPTFNEVRISSSSIIFTSCSMFSQALSGTMNLISVCGPEFSGSAGFRLMSLDDRANDNLLGVFSQEFAAEVVNPLEVQFRTIINGWYNGPVEIAAHPSPGYVVQLRQVKRGEIEGGYGQVLFDDQGGSQYVFSRRIYRYDSNETLPGDEVMVYRVLEVNRRVDHTAEDYKITIDFRSQAYYVPMAQDTFVNVN